MKNSQAPKVKIAQTTCPTVADAVTGTPGTASSSMSTITDMIHRLPVDRSPRPDRPLSGCASVMVPSRIPSFFQNLLCPTYLEDRDERRSRFEMINHDVASSVTFSADISSVISEDMASCQCREAHGRLCHSPRTRFMKEISSSLQGCALTAMTAGGAGSRTDGRQKLTVGCVVTGTLRDRERRLVSTQIWREWRRRAPERWGALTPLAAGRASPLADAGERLAFDLIEAFALSMHLRDFVAQIGR